MRIAGLASGMDIDSMVKEMMVGEKEKVDKAKQEQQIVKWKQEIYKDVIKDTKSLYDKYLSMTSSNSIISSKNYTNIAINSSNSNVITAVAGPGAEKVNYDFEITQIAEPPKASGKITNDDLVEGLEIVINVGNETKTITISENETIKSLLEKINKEFSDGSIKASYSEMTGKFTISGNETGDKSTINISGSFFESVKMESNDGSIITKDGMTIKGKNLEGRVLDSSGNEIRTLNESKNSLTLDNITYNVHSKGEAKLTGVNDTTKAVENMKSFINDYNKLMEKVYDLVTKKKPNDYPPLTDDQKKEMTKEEIESWEAKAKEGILRNDSELRAFMDDIQSAIFGSLEGFGITLKEMGISSHQDYNKKNQIQLDEEKFSNALIEKGDIVYKALTVSTSDNKNEGIFEKLKDTVYKYAGSSTSIFGKKAGFDSSSTEVNNVFSKEIKKQEDNIKRLIEKMENKEQQLYNKFAALESNLNKYNSQMSYFMQGTGY